MYDLIALLLLIIRFLGIFAHYRKGIFAVMISKRPRLRARPVNEVWL